MHETRLLTALVIGVILGCVTATARPEDFTPTGLHVGTKLDPHVSKFATFTLDGTNPLATLAMESKSRKTLTVHSISSLVSNNTFRVETFNVTTTGRLSSFQVQGGQRWQSIRLLNVDQGSVTFTAVRLRASFQSLPSSDLPGYFESDDSELNAIWKLGTRAVQAVCLAPKEQPASWLVDKDGVVVESQRPAVSHLTTELKNYALGFDAQVVRGGLLWGVGWPIVARLGGGILLLLTGSMPASSFLNHDYTALPRNTIDVGFGRVLPNGTTITNQHRFSLPLSVDENTEYRFRTTYRANGDLSVAINSMPVLNVSVASYSAAPESLMGGFGFGAWQDCRARYRNVVATDLLNGTVLYANNLTSTSTSESDAILAEYGVQPNPAGVCPDGAKRDRMMWLRDLYHTVRIVSASTQRWEVLGSTLEAQIQTQLPSGEIALAFPIGYEAGLKVGLRAFGCVGVYHYVRGSGDVAHLRSNWGLWKRTVEYFVAQINGTDGLVHLPNGPFRGGGHGGAASSCITVLVLDKATELAEAAEDAAAAEKRRNTSVELRTTIQSKLWNDERAFFSTQTITTTSPPPGTDCVSSRI
ncbi:glycoside hydrolase family 78 protein [Gonapodya prolifera JEL478]|uniref:Glycoside hydrolase family 78 protein n=1 Tax=Gonapodya prolifera (strain JEL478) TaxID=1344416 RepID=A0A139AD02_GONPJ|nr:glycoside hydrolase family 78 protein [Gonapodya prolifera JEL478]|eukprot:KXS14657.1 glycoside hydrolase family 78 protein [Gonapodya prolifera JEL478]